MVYGIVLTLFAYFFRHIHPTTMDGQWHAVVSRGAVEDGADDPNTRDLQGKCGCTPCRMQKQGLCFDHAGFALKRMKHGN